MRTHATVSYFHLLSLQRLSAIYRSMPVGYLPDSELTLANSNTVGDYPFDILSRTRELYD